MFEAKANSLFSFKNTNLFLCFWFVSNIFLITKKKFFLFCFSKIDLSECQLVQVPDAVYHLMRNTELKSCDLSSNVIKKIPPKFAVKFNLITGKKVKKHHSTNQIDDVSLAAIIISLIISIFRLEFIKQSNEQAARRIGWFGTIASVGHFAQFILNVAKSCIQNAKIATIESKQQCYHRWVHFLQKFRRISSNQN